MKLKDYLLCVLAGVMGFCTLLEIGLLLLWLYDQPAAVRTVVAAVAAGLAVLVLAGLLGADWLKKRRARRYKLDPIAQAYTDDLINMVQSGIMPLPPNPIPKTGGKPVKFRGIQNKEDE